jgi:probable F420-dependent oxidoreductase
MQVETVLIDGHARGQAALNEIARSACEAEELGFDRITTPETGHDPFLPLIVAAEHTARIELGTNVAIAFPRSPMAVAQMSWDLQRVSSGRFVLGLGTQVKGHNERRYQSPWTGPPGPRMREYVLCLRSIFETFQSPARPSYVEGEYYNFTLMTPFFNPGPLEHGDVPVQIAALNPYMARLAGEICDGVRVHPLATAAYTRDVILPAVERGAKKAGRTPKEIDVVATPFVVTGATRDEVEAAKAGTRQHIAFYASTRTYHAVLEHHGWGETGRTLHAMSTEGRWGEMGRLIDDEMLAEFAVIGTYNEVAPALAERWRGICSTLFLGVAPALRQERALVRSMLDALHAA